MNLMELKKDLTAKKLNKLYIFTGEEIAILRIYINKISKLFPGKTFEADSLSSIVNKLKSNSLIQTEKSMFIIRDDKSILTAEKIWKSLKSGTFQNGNILVLTYTNIDKRGKFYKEFADNIIYFEHLSKDVLYKYIIKECEINKNNASYLIDICKNDYNMILLELDKIKNLSLGLNISHDEAFNMCIQNNAFYIPPDGEIFDLLNSILSGNIKETYAQLKMFEQRGDSPIVVLSLLHNNLKSILQVQCTQGYPNVGQITGLNGFQIKNAQKFCNLYTEQELIRMIKINRFCEKCIKQTGLIDIDMILDFMFVKIF